MYDGCDSVGLVYMFISDGYEALLKGDKPFQSLYRDQLLRKALLEARQGHTKKIEVVRIRELIPTMARLSLGLGHGGEETQLGNLLLAHGDRLYYDSPKIVEAIIRIARFARFGQEPIFRFDADVEVDDENVKKLLDCYQRLAEKADLAYHATQKRDSYYFFSGRYRAKTKDERDKNFNFTSVRTGMFYSPKSGRFQHKLAEHFLGTLGAIGADPFNQAISGAGLCISPTAINALPPFANAPEPIIWIDDHLKRILHEVMGHFGKDQPQRDRICPDSTFIQDRYPNPEIDLSEENVAWHRGDYLKRLVRGCLLDAAISDRQGGGIVGGLIAAGAPLPLKVVEVALDGTLRARLEAVRKEWASHHGSPIKAFATQELQDTETCNKLVGDVVQTVYRYLFLCWVWPTFVARCQAIDPAENEWLFRAPL